MKWFDREPKRLRAEAAALRHFYPEARLARRDGRLWVMSMVVVKETAYRCELEYPDHYPGAMMRAFVRSPPLERSPHQFSGGELCLVHASEVSDRTTAVCWMTWTAEWLRRYQHFQETKIWID